MTTTPVIAGGPVGFETTDGKYFTVPLNVLSYDGSKIQVTGWNPPPGSTASVTDVANWAQYLFDQDEIVPAPSNATPAAGPAFLVEAVYPGKARNNLTLSISNVQTPPANPPYATTMTLTVSYTESYLGIGPTDLSTLLGIAPNGGTEPGLLYLSGVAALPDGTGNPVAVTSPSVTIPTNAFTLDTVPNSTPADTFTVDINNVNGGANTFDMIVTWTKTVQNKTLADHATAFQAVITITPPVGGYGVPANTLSPIPLNNGTDAGTTQPTPAMATIPSA